MLGRPSEFTSEHSKICWVLSFMQTGTARTWRDYVVSRMLRHDWMFKTGDELLSEIQAKFGDMDKQSTASLKLRTMMQGDKPVDEHVQEFEKAALEAEYYGKPLIAEFKRSLNIGLRHRLMELDPLPQTIGGWYQVAIKFDRQWRIAKAEEAFYGRANVGKKCDAEAEVETEA